MLNLRHRFLQEQAGSKRRLGELNRDLELLKQHFEIASKEWEEKETISEQGGSLTLLGSRKRHRVKSRLKYVRKCPNVSLVTYEKVLLIVYVNLDKLHLLSSSNS